MSGLFADNPNYVTSENLLKRLHELIAEGKGDKAIDHAPIDALGWVLRGITRMLMLSSAARNDFQKAIALHTVQFEPYLFLAQDALEQGQYNRTLTLCSSILKLPQEPEVQAAAWQLTAIAQFEMKYPHEMVRASFQNAMSLNPNNEKIKQDYAFIELTEKANSITQGAHWHLASQERLQKARTNDTIEFQASVFV